MKLNNAVKTLIVAGGLAATPAAWSLTLTDVGGLDNFIASASLGNSGAAVEESWVESTLSALTGSAVDVSLDSSYDSSGGSDWTLLDGESDVFAASLTTNPAYYLVKIGTGGTSLNSHYLFENIGDLSYAVIDFSDAGIDFTLRNVSIDRISHVTEFGGTTVNVPEPASLMLLGLGLAGLGMQRKRSQK